MNIIRKIGIGLKKILKIIISLFKYFFIGIYTVITIIPKYFIIGISTIFNRKKNNNSISDKKVSTIMLGLSLTVYLICVFLISKWSVQKLKIRYLADDIVNSTEIIENQEEREQQHQNNNEEQNQNVDTDNTSQNTTQNSTYYPNDYWDYMSVPFINVNFDELLSKNPDTVGWIKVDGTKVNYPVVQSTDNDYYLNHAFNRNENIAGWIYADYRDDFTDFGKNTIIYGHNMNNKTMFGSVPSMLNNSYLKNSSNYYIKISTPTSNSNWKVFSIYTIEPEVYYLKTMFISEPFENFITTLKNRSVYDFGIDVNADDKILTLSTCDNTGTKRVAVHAKMINIEYK